MRALAVVAGVLLAVVVLVLAALGLAESYSPSGWLMLVSLASITAGAVTAPWRRSHRRGVARAGAALFASVVVGRVVLIGAGDTVMVTLPDGSGSRWLGRVVDEQDGALVGARLLAVAWRLPEAERSQIVPAMGEAYAAMRASEGLTPSPVLDTVLRRQGPDGFDALIVEPHGRPAQAAVVFLHGFGGSFTLECWMMAEAARAVEAMTVCPSTGFAGRWWAPDGERTLRKALAHVAARGIRRVYLAGLSNGGIGATLLARRLAGSLAGLILVSGASPEGSTGGLPALVVQGEGDTMVSAQVTRAFAARTGAVYAGFDGGHFVMMVRRAEVREAIVRWLREGARRP
jgi:predicted esterase